MDVDEGGDCLYLGTLLGMVDEVSLAGLVFGIPFEDVELRIICWRPLTPVSRCVGGGTLECLLYLAVRASGEVHKAKARYTPSAVIAIATPATSFTALHDCEAFGVGVAVRYGGDI